ncbi:MetQ/NlpA family ABC transporter substrate-binding protein [Frondihabitans sp. VKM Ac-2883]|uniref:MetQ/NlpA family ABC transporter substrate-binding protein n=1 Tax=Frondihabitans sp. VKM Ac-2883 TaxID=2783823 RepID=UPI001889F6A7|nr:MetQ/NlpA family ABC transporter substrate-binding protein [Frondihabitans sp. VKM Ac-2883]MBF4576926.1 metal ABC transporter substrate-binding protein [Frondihabitans sp. VKM Ac-2883]
MSAPQLPARARNRRPLVIGIIAAIVVIVVVIVLIVVNRSNADDSASGAAPKTVSIGVVDASEPYWKTYSTLAKDKYNVTIKLVNFSDYSQPNPALSQGQTDLNEFQHIQYLANYNVTTGSDLQPIGATAVYPLPLYSTKYSTPSELPEGAKVAIPNDAVNEARGLLVLQAADLITLKDGGNAFSTVTDIETKKVDVTALDASQTANALKSNSVAAAIVNQNFATQAGFQKDEAIFKDDPSSTSAAPYVNVFVAQNKDKNNSLYLDLAKLYHTASVEKGVQEANNDTAVFRDTSAADLQKELATVESDAKAAAK